MTKEEISQEVKEAGLFSVPMDSTQDVHAHGHCPLVVRYTVGDKAKERLIRFMNINDSSSKSILNLFSQSVSGVGINFGTVYWGLTTLVTRQSATASVIRQSTTSLVTGQPQSLESHKL